jgi:hypothetical protein
LKISLRILGEWRKKQKKTKETMKLQPSSFVNISRLPETRQQQQTAQKGDEEKEGEVNSMETSLMCLVPFSYVAAAVMIVLEHAWMDRESFRDNNKPQPMTHRSQITAHMFSIACLGVSLSPSLSLLLALLILVQIHARQRR